MNILITGSDGFVAKNLIFSLRERNKYKIFEFNRSHNVDDIKKYINDMISNRRGKIMIVSSVAAFAPASSLQSLYGPVKTFMNRFSESLSFYNKYGITSTAVCPGYTVTNFHTASGVQAEMDSVPSFLKKSAKRIAEEGVEAMMRGKKVSVPTKTWKIIVFLIKIIPHSVFRLASGLLAPGRYNDI